MRYKTLWLLSLFFALGINTLLAQVKSIETEVSEHLTYDELVLKGRDLLLQTLKKEDQVKAAEILNYLEQKMDSSYRKKSITVQEKVHTQLLIGQFEHLVKNNYFTSGYKNKESQYHYRTVDWNYTDQLSTHLTGVIKQKKTAISTSIQEYSDLNQEEKDFLHLLLAYYTSNSPYGYKSDEVINQQTDQFLLAYPVSIFNPFIRSNIRKVYVPSKWGINYEISAGYMEGTEYIGNTFNPGFAFGFSGGVTYHNFLLRLDGHIGITSPTKDIRLGDTIWEKGHSSNIGQFASSVGYIIAAQKKISIIPLLGIGTTSITPSQSMEADQIRYENVAYKAQLTYFASLGVKYKLSEFNGPFNNTHAYLMLSYRFSNPKLDRKYTGVTGNVHLVTLSYGGLIRFNKRDL